MGFRSRRIMSKLRRLRLLQKMHNVLPLLSLLLLTAGIAFLGYQIFWDSIGGFNHSLARAIISWGMPYSSEYSEDGSNTDRLRSLLYLLTDFDLANPVSMVENTLPNSLTQWKEEHVWEEYPFVFIQELSFAPDPVRPDEIAPNEPVVTVERVEDTAPRVLVYHSHTSEQYLGRPVLGGNSAAAHYVFKTQSDGTVTGIMEVGRHLSSALQKLGIPTMHETKIHDLPSINYAYSNSERTVREILDQNDQIEMVLDVHRDANVPDAAVMINGRSVARILLVLGTAQAIPLSHPNYQENVAFAQRLQETADRLYPGLMRPIQIRQDARYNQHLHSQSIIIELGSVENTLEEALLSAELLANVLAQML